jgi:hypothetical protein
MKLAALVVSSLILVSSALSLAQDNSPATQHVIWGMLSGNKGCVIFAEGHKTTGRFYGIAVTTKTVGKLTLIEAVNYTFNQHEVLETQENMDNLSRLAQQDRIKFVKIPEKYSPDLLENARDACKPATN